MHRACAVAETSLAESHHSGSVSVARLYPIENVDGKPSQPLPCLYRRARLLPIREKQRSHGERGKLTLNHLLSLSVSCKPLEAERRK